MLVSGRVTLFIAAFGAHLDKTLVYLHLPYKFRFDPNVRKYTSPMDPMGIGKHLRYGILTKTNRSHPIFQP